MVRQRSNETFERRTRAAFVDSTARLDAATRSRLTEARYAALEAARSSSPRLQWISRWVWGLPAGAAAILAFALLLNGRGSPVPAPTVLEDLPIASENLDLLEDVEFYAWLDEAAKPAGETG